MGLLCLLGRLCSLDFSYFRWAVELLGCWAVVFIESVVFVGSFYFRWAVGSVVLVGSVVFVGSFYFRWAVGLARKKWLQLLV